MTVQPSGHPAPVTVFCIAAEQPPPLSIGVDLPADGSLRPFDVTVRADCLRTGSGICQPHPAALWQYTCSAAADPATVVRIPIAAATATTAPATTTPPGPRPAWCDQRGTVPTWLWDVIGWLTGVRC